MPEAHRPPRAALYKLISENADQGYLVQVECCGVRYYLPADLMRLFGDFPSVEVQKHLRRCERCGSREHLKISYVLPTAEEKAKLRVRKLKAIRLKRIPVWKDEEL